MSPFSVEGQQRYPELHVRHLLFSDLEWPKLFAAENQGVTLAGPGPYPVPAAVDSRTRASTKVLCQKFCHHLAAWGCVCGGSAEVRSSEKVRNCCCVHRRHKDTGEFGPVQKPQNVSDISGDQQKLYLIFRKEQS